MRMRARATIVAMALAASMASSAALADEMFLKFVATPEILGNSTDPQHRDELVVLSYAIGVEAESSWTKGGGASVGKPNPGEFRFTTTMNRAIPAIMKYITTGKAAASATLTLRTDPPGAQAGFEYAKYTFEGMFFTGVEQGIANASGTASIAISAVYKTLKIQQFSPGRPVAVSCMKWDIPAGTAGDC